MRMQIALPLLLALWSGSLLAVEQIVLFAIFGEKAILHIDGERRMLGVGEQSPEGVTLLATSGESVEIDISGEKRTIALGNQIAVSSESRRAPSVQLWPDQRGMYLTTASINGRTMEVLVDTGATLVSMSERHAIELGLDYRGSQHQGQVETASGVANAYGVDLNRVKLGSIELYDIPALVVQGDYPSKILLGMSFLKRLKIEHSGSVMVLKKRW